MFTYQRETTNIDRDTKIQTEHKLSKESYTKPKFSSPQLN